MEIHDAADIDPAKIRPRRRRDHPRIEVATQPVRVSGETLSEIWWQGTQWAVTAYGLECRDGCYPIEGKRLLEDLPGYSWPEHMAEKTWVDIDDFATAWMIALLLHGLSRKKLAKSVRERFGRLPPNRRFDAD
jgi:hypothetical protein